MDWNALSDTDFRTEVRRFVEQNFPAHLRNHPRRIPRWETMDVSGSLTALRLYYRSRPATIYSGSTEVQKNLLAKRVLGLPAA